MFRKSLVTLTLAAGLVVAGGGIASAHECYVPNRSEQGNAHATKSGNWETLYLEDLFAEAHFFLGGRALTAAEIDMAVERAVDAGVPSSVTIFLPKLLPAAGPAGTGIDHFFTDNIDTLAGIYFGILEEAEEAAE